MTTPNPTGTLEEPDSAPQGRGAAGRSAAAATRHGRPQHTAGRERPATTAEPRAHPGTPPTPESPGHLEEPLRQLARAAWPEHDGDPLPPVPGFIVSTFNPLVAEVAERCLSRAHGAPGNADERRTSRTALVLASWNGDLATAHALHEAVRTGRRVQPLLFFQSNPNAVAGYVAGRWGLQGPVVCVRTARPGPAALTEALETAALLLLDGDCDEVLVVAADGGPAAGGEPGSAVAVLVEAERVPARRPGDTASGQGDQPQ